MADKRQADESTDEIQSSMNKRNRTGMLNFWSRDAARGLLSLKIVVLVFSLHALAWIKLFYHVRKNEKMLSYGITENEMQQCRIFERFAIGLVKENSIFAPSYYEPETFI